MMGESQCQFSLIELFGMMSKTARFLFVKLKQGLHGLILINGAFDPD